MVRELKTILSLAELAESQEEKLKKKMGRAYRTPWQRYLDECHIMPETNDELGDLPFVEAVQN